MVRPIPMVYRTKLAFDIGIIPGFKKEVTHYTCLENTFYPTLWLLFTKDASRIGNSTNHHKNIEHCKYRINVGFILFALVSSTWHLYNTLAKFTQILWISFNKTCFFQVRKILPPGFDVQQEILEAFFVLRQGPVVILHKFDPALCVVVDDGKPTDCFFTVCVAFLSLPRTYWCVEKTYVYFQNPEKLLSCFGCQIWQWFSFQVLDVFLASFRVLSSAFAKPSRHHEIFSVLFREILIEDCQTQELFAQIPEMFGKLPLGCIGHNCIDCLVPKKILHKFQVIARSGHDLWCRKPRPHVDGDNKVANLHQAILFPLGEFEFAPEQPNFDGINSFAHPPSVVHRPGAPKLDSSWRSFPKKNNRKLQQLQVVVTRLSLLQTAKVVWLMPVSVSSTQGILTVFTDIFASAKDNISCFVSGAMTYSAGRLSSLMMYFAVSIFGHSCWKRLNSSTSGPEEGPMTSTNTPSSTSSKMWWRQGSSSKFFPRKPIISTAAPFFRPITSNQAQFIWIQCIQTRCAY